MKRSFKRGVHDTYDETFDHLRLNSLILNAGNLPLSVHTPILDQAGLKSLILEYKGADENGNYFKGGTKKIAILPGIYSQLIDLEKAFLKQNSDREEMGKEIIPDIESSPLFEKKLRLLAQLDVSKEELEILTRKLSAFTSSTQYEDDGKMLAFGLKLSGTLRDGQLSILDGMTVGRTPEKVLAILDPRSPYNGMSVLDYRKLAGMWQEQRRQADKDKLKRIQEDAKKKGLPRPSSLPVFAPKRVDRNSLPAWPEWATNYLALSENE